VLASLLNGDLTGTVHAREPSRPEALSSVSVIGNALRRRR
jgi:hypothetical protein